METAPIQTYEKSISVRHKLSHPYPLLLLSVLLFQLAIAVILILHGLPICLIPQGIVGLAGTLFISMPLCAAGIILISEILSDGFSAISGGEIKPVKDRFIDSGRIALSIFALAFVYLLVYIPYLNLKPAIPLINPNTYDIALESWERFIFGGVLPTEWFINNSSYFAAFFWEIIYGLFAPFIFISLAIALKYEGFSGGSSLILSYITGLFLCLLLALVFPTMGPIFTHPDWFERFSGLPSNQLAAFLTDTVRVYAQLPGTVYGCGGISAMPSYHIYACAAGLMYWRHLPRGFQLFGTVLVLLIWISTFALGWHYALDGIAGLIMAYSLWKGINAVWRRFGLPK